MKHILFLDFDDLLKICTSLEFRCDHYQKIIDERSDDFPPDFLAEAADIVSNLTRILGLLSGYLTKGIVFNENCLPDLESRLPDLISGFVKGDLAFISLNEVGAADANDLEGGEADEK